jgi:serine/threonine protein kinase/Leucine-rich repeat (LRR) protein
MLCDPGSMPLAIAAAATKNHSSYQHYDHVTTLFAPSRLSGVQCMPCPKGTYSPSGRECLFAPIHSYAPAFGSSCYLHCPQSLLEGAIVCEHIDAKDAKERDTKINDREDSVIAGDYIVTQSEQARMSPSSFTPPTSDEGWAGYTLVGQQNPSVQYKYVLHLFDHVEYVGGFDGAYIIGSFTSYSSSTGTYSLTGGSYCSASNTLSAGTVKFTCAEVTSFLSEQYLRCMFVALYFHGPMFCPDGVYTPEAGDPTLSPTSRPTPAPTERDSDLPAYALEESYVKDILLSLDSGSWAKKFDWYYENDLEWWQNVWATIDNSTGVRRLAAPMALTHSLADYYNYDDYYYYYYDDYVRDQFPQELANLSSCIWSLQFSDTSLQGTIPAFLGEFIYLEELLLSNNNFYGTIPSELGKNTALKRIYLDRNALYGQIPSSLFLHAEVITINNNYLTGFIPKKIGNSLETLFASHNQLSGTIVSQLASSSLLRLDLSFNNLTGTFPDALCDVSYTELLLGGNVLGCYQPCVDAGYTDVTSYYSRCRSDIDSALCDLSAALDVSSAIVGRYYNGDSKSYDTGHLLPYTWESSFSFSFTAADLLEVSFDCQSQLVASMIRIYDSDGVNLYDAAALGTDAVPGCGSQPPLSLAVDYLLVVFSNYKPVATYGFSISVTSQYLASGWDCEDLTDDYSVSSVRRKLSSDLYAGDFCSWYGISCLSGVTLSEINLPAMGMAGTIPSSIYLLDDLEVLDLGYNSLSGTIPTALASLTKLTSINLASNRFSKTLPSALVALTALQSLQLSSNSLTGTVSTFLGQLTSLTTLDLSTNKFRGSLSDSLCPLVNEGAAVKLQDNFITCYESHCYDYVNNTRSIKFDYSVDFCLSSGDKNEWTAGATAGITIAAVFIFVASIYIRRNDRVKYWRYPIHKAIATGKPVTEELLAAHQDQIMAIVNGNTVTDLIFNRGAKVDITGTVLGKLVMMRMVEEEARIMNEAILAAAEETNNPVEEDVDYRELRGSMHAIEELAQIGLEMMGTAKDKVAEEAEKLKEDVIGVVTLGHHHTLGFDDKGHHHHHQHHYQPQRDSTAAPTSTVYEDWIVLVQEDDERSQIAVNHILQAMPDKIASLSDCTDERGRRCIDIASAPCKEILRRSSYLCYRYELKQGPLEHISATSAVIFGVDHGEWKFQPLNPTTVSNHILRSARSSESITVPPLPFELAKDGEELLGFSRPGKDVCLKFMHNKEQYLTEIDVRSRSQLDPGYVISVLRAFDGDSIATAETENQQLHDSTLFRRGAVSKGFESYPYCIVMDRAEQSLKRIIDHNHIVGQDWDTIKTMFRQITHAVDHMHDRQLIHGDLKPMNIMQAGGKMLLIDLDASASFSESNHQFAGSKYSSAYLPPELIVVGWDGNACVRVPRLISLGETTSSESLASPAPTSSPGSFRTNQIPGSFRLASPRKSELRRQAGFRVTKNKIPDACFGTEYDVVKADPSLDLWALGCILYLLCTGMNLFRATVEDNVGSDVDLRALMEWSMKTKNACLAEVEDKLARNLISLLLNKDPSKRPDCSHILSHPFLAGKHPGRLQGELPQYDVFLSYRVSSDAKHVKHLHDMLEARGLTVWWDKKCLLPGQPWEEGFCAGLADSGHFVCLLSRGAINSEKPWENFSKLEAGSRCDNVLLEWRLALELKRRGMIEGMFPILIGDVIEDPTTHSVTYSHYNRTGCGPKDLPAVPVLSMEQKLRDHLDREGLGAPFEDEMTVADITKEILASQGGFIVHHAETAWNTVVEQIVRMVHVTAERHAHEAADASPATAGNEYEILASKYKELQNSFEELFQENQQLLMTLRDDPDPVSVPILTLTSRDALDREDAVMVTLTTELERPATPKEPAIVVTSKDSI